MKGLGLGLKEFREAIQGQVQGQVQGQGEWEFKLLIYIS